MLEGCTYNTSTCMSTYIVYVTELDSLEDLPEHLPHGILADPVGISLQVV